LEELKTVNMELNISFEKKAMENEKLKIEL